MSTVSPPVPAPTADPAALALASYNQNFETFRSLNALMWQIPLIAMTLTGGLWFGVSKAGDDIWFKTGLLSLAGVGNIGLTLILERLRFIMAKYLDWLEAAAPSGFVHAKGTGLLTRDKRVKQIFQTMLCFAAVISFVLMFSGMQAKKPTSAKNAPTAAAWYDAHAEQLADGYESIEAQATHPELFAMVAGAKSLRVLDVGAGTGRDAAALADMGHTVTAIDPSKRMLQLARALHPKSKVQWLEGQLPELRGVQGPYDLVVLSAVWMHVAPQDRRASLRRLASIIEPNGKIYVTLRVGPDDQERGMYSVSIDEIQRLIQAEGLKLQDLGTRLDLLGRKGVSWRVVLLTK